MTRPDPEGLAIVRDWLAAVNRGEAERFIAEGVAEDVIVDEGTAGTFIPDAEILHGRDGFLTSLRKGTDLFDDVHVELVHHAAGPDALLIGMRVTGTGKGSGVPLDFVRWDVYRFRDGLIGSVHLFGDQQDAERAAGVTE